MQPVPEFLNEIERRLRCPADRRPAVIEELRGHLTDRVEALTAQGLPQPDAERRAVREMGAVSLLALRLSATNGWNVTAHILREWWAAGVGAFILLAVTGPINLLVVRVETPGALATHRAVASTIGVGGGMGVVLAVLALLAGLTVFSFALGRTVRGWLWVALPILVTAANLTPLVSPTGVAWIGAFSWLAAATVMSSCAYLGQRRELPRRQRLAWASAGAILVGGLLVVAVAHLVSVGAPLMRLPQALLLVLREVPAGAAANSAPTLTGLTALAMPWLFWLGAWAIERANRSPATTVAE